MRQAKNTVTDIIFLSVLLVYIFLYEWSIFEYSAIKPIVDSLKIIIPIFLISITIFSNLSYKQFKPFQNYIILLGLFFVWAFIPSLLSDSYESISQWSKFIPRVIATIAIGIFFISRIQIQTSFIKILGICGIIIVIQFICLNIYLLENPIVKPFAYNTVGAKIFGPLGLFGIKTRALSFHGIGFDLMRLTGFWREPSNASGFLFATFFLVQGVYVSTAKYLWRIIALVCLLGGFLCLSNAGYLGFGIAFLFGLIRKSNLPKIKISHLIGIIFAVSIILFAVLGRYYVTNLGIDSALLRASTGSNLHSNNLSYDEITVGRLSLIQTNLNIFLAHPVGIGIRLPGETGFKDASASAFAYWLTFTGLPGIMLLLIMQLQIVYTIFKYPISEFQLKIAQAWLALTFQQCVYGTWMNPFYLTLAILVFASIYRYQYLQIRARANNNRPAGSPA